MVPMMMKRLLLASTLDATSGQHVWVGSRHGYRNTCCHAYELAGAMLLAPTVRSFLLWLWMDDTWVADSDTHCYSVAGGSPQCWAHIPTVHSPNP